MSGTNFFDFREQVTARRAPAQPPAQPDALSVSQLTAQIDAALRRGVPPSVFVKGEVSNFSLHRASGNLYFTLKDERACIDCVMFRSEAQRLKFDPADGMELLAQGRVGVYAQRGRYQLYVQTLQPLGAGALEHKACSPPSERSRCRRTRCALRW
jgi:exodeoxyribonuclease VII large subunit